MTGDGKSLAAYLSVLQSGDRAIGLYPTNELARDQENQLKGYIDKFGFSEDLRVTPLNQQGIYVTPARAINHATTLNTWKYADNRYHVEMKQTERNIPSFGRTKEIAPESQFEFFIISAQTIALPRWVRLGKWASKAELICKELPKPKHHQNNEFNVSFPLNPLDVMFTNQVLSYDTVNMPPVSLIRNVRMIGEYYTFDDLAELKLPVRMQYQFGN
jgi:CRISPR-associated protein Csc1